MSDEAARERIRADLQTSLLVEAAAGTGKTTELVRRLVAVLEGGADVEGVVAVTFTRKAAGELKLRLRQQLDVRLETLRAQRGGRDESTDPGMADDAAVTGIGCLERAIQRLERAHVGTIHSFCAELLRERPVEAGIDPDFVGLSESEAPRLFRRAFRAWSQAALDQMPDGVRRALSRFAVGGSFDQRSPLERLEMAAWQLVEWRDFPARWRRPDFDRSLATQSCLDAVVELAALACQASNPRDVLRQDLEPAVAFAAWHERSSAIDSVDEEATEARLVEVLRGLKRNQRKGSGAFGPALERGTVLAARTLAMERLAAYAALCDADLAASLQVEFEGLLEGYEELKRIGGKLDFVDLLLRTRDLLRTSSSVRGFLQERFSHIFVDEFQDTDPLQAEILMLLASQDPTVGDWRNASPKPGKLFLVGDPKQSIYRFRRADVSLYQEVKDYLRERGVEVVQLQRSFRATAALQAAINRAFAPEMVLDRQRGQTDYIPLESVRPSPNDQPSLVALPIGRPYGWTKVTQKRLEESLPATVGAWLHWLLEESSWQVEDPNTKARRGVLPSDVCVLFRRYIAWGRDITRDYTRALEMRGIPHVLVGERTFHQREEVETLRAALTAVEWPDDELAVFATLHGNLFAIDDATLLEFRTAAGRRFHPFGVRVDDPLRDRPEFVPVFEALDFLAALHRRRNRRPLVETLQELLEFSRAHAAFALRPAGNQVLANVQRVCDLARGWERGGGLSFRGFVDRLVAEADRPTEAQSPMIEEGAEGVRLMTVHAAKGLEFPVVVLADMTAHLARNEPDKHVDRDAGLCAQRIGWWSPLELLEAADSEVARDEAEGVRVAYVAATRARDLMVVPAVGDEARPGWLSPLNRAIHPAGEDRRSARPGVGCPEFGPTTVLERPRQVDHEGDFSVRPGSHEFEDGSYQVVWWDPALLESPVDDDFGLRQAEILNRDADARVIDRSLDDYESWKTERAERLTLGSRPRHAVAVVTELEEEPEATIVVTTESSRPAGSRPAGIRFGTLVHTLLRDVDLSAGAEDAVALARVRGALLEANEEERSAAASATLAALDHPLLERARQAELRGECFREAPFTLALADGRLLEGTLDLAFRDGDSWIVVDFKTDTDLEFRRTHYERQIRWYAFALSRIWQEPVSAVLLAV